MFVRIGHRDKRCNADADQQQENTENTAEHNPDDFPGAHTFFGRHGRINRVGRRRGINPLSVRRLSVRRWGLGLSVRRLSVRRRGLRLPVRLLPIGRCLRLPVRRHRCGIRYRRYGARRMRRRNRIRRARLGTRLLHGHSRRNGRLFRRNRLFAFIGRRGLFVLLCYRVLNRRCIRRMEKIILKICYGNLPLSFFSIIVQDFAFAVNTRFTLPFWAVCRNTGAFVVFPGKV